MVGDGVFQDYDGVWLGVNKVNMILRHPAVLSYHFNIIVLQHFYYSLPLSLTSLIFSILLAFQAFSYLNLYN